MQYRKWAYEDILAVAALEKECFRDPWSYRMLADSFFSDSTITVLAEEDGKVLGYGFLIAPGEDADLANIAVGTEYRRRGIAQLLLIGRVHRIAEVFAGDRERVARVREHQNVVRVFFVPENRP